MKSASILYTYTSAILMAGALLVGTGACGVDADPASGQASRSGADSTTETAQPAVATPNAKAGETAASKGASSGAIADYRNFQKPAAAELKKQLTDIQFYVTQEDGTERPFANEFWNHKKEGIYVDIVSGEPLFSSRDKFRSGTGWPSFTKPLEDELVVEKKDLKFGMVRIELRSRYGDSHLGHVFNDGPAPTGLRYCINSASLRFIPRAELKAAGYEAYAW